MVHEGLRIMLDGGTRSEPGGHLDAWLVTDERAELITSIRHLARQRGLEAHAADFTHRALRILRRPVVHTNHPTFGYLILAGDSSARVVWAPEFLEFPVWAARADLMFAEAAGWNRPIRFVGGTGGHLDTCSVATEARRRNVRRLVFSHIGRPTIRAMDRGEMPSFGEFARDGQVFHLRRTHTSI